MTTENYEPTVDDVVAVAEKELLLSGGVDNWDWYSESLEDYTEHENDYLDAHAFLQALENGGVDNWEWYSESLKELAEYEEYVKSLSTPSSALSYYQWEQEGIEANRKAQEDTEDASETDDTGTSEETNTPVVETESDKVLYDFISSVYGKAHADDLFALLKNDGTLYKHNTFPTEFKKALKVIEQGVENPTEKARLKHLELLSKNGKLKSHIDTLQES